MISPFSCRPRSRTHWQSLWIALLILAAATGAARGQGRVYDFARSLSLNTGLQGRLLWVDATANLDRIMTPEGVRDIVARARRANINCIVLDVKPVVGQVIYASKIAKPLTSWRGKSYPQFDVLAAFVKECRAAGLELAVSMNVLSEGHKYFGVGLAYERPELQSQTFVVDRALVSQSGARLPVRGAADPPDPSRPLVRGDDFVLEASGTPGSALAVVLDGTGRLEGLLDPALLGDVPLSAPEDGNLLVADKNALEWIDRHARIGTQTRFDAVGRRMPIVEAGSEIVAAFVNPLHPEARRHAIDLLVEVAANYDIDAVVYDRLRYSSIYSDYSDLSRQAFEKWLGRTVSRWPDDVIRADPNPSHGIRRGPLFREWLEFRARVIRELVREASQKVRAARPQIRIGAYVGSWFGEYFGVGVNWGSEKFRVRYSWATPKYNEAGYAEFLDWLSTGCYYPIATRAEARALGKNDGGTVEAAAELSSIAVANATPVYAGLYVLNYQGNPEAFARAINAAVRWSQGVMIFDVSYLYDYDWWQVLERAFPAPALAPHTDRLLAAQMRAALDAVRPVRETRATAPRLPAVPYQSGGG